MTASLVKIIGESPHSGQRHRYSRQVIYYHGTCVTHVCVTHVPWCMPGLLTSGFLWSWCRGKRSRHSRRMHNPQCYVSAKRPMVDSSSVPSITTNIFHHTEQGSPITAATLQPHILISPFHPRTHQKLLNRNGPNSGHAPQKWCWQNQEPTMITPMPKNSWKNCNFVPNWM